jgi:hypothetical protein
VWYGQNFCILLGKKLLASTDLESRIPVLAMASKNFAATQSVSQTVFTGLKLTIAFKIRRKAINLNLGFSQ